MAPGLLPGTVLAARAARTKWTSADRRSGVRPSAPTCSTRARSARTFLRKTTVGCQGVTSTRGSAMSSASVYSISTTPSFEVVIRAAVPALHHT